MNFTIMQTVNVLDALDGIVPGDLADKLVRVGLERIDIALDVVSDDDGLHVMPCLSDSERVNLFVRFGRHVFPVYATYMPKIRIAIDKEVSRISKTLEAREAAQDEYAGLLENIAEAS